MKKKKKPVQVNIQALQQLLSTLPQLSESKKEKLRNTAAATLAVMAVLSLFGPMLVQSIVRAFDGSW